MGLSRHERRILRGIGKDMRRRDPEFASMLGRFGSAEDVARGDKAAEGGNGGTDREKKRKARGKSPWTPGGYTPLILF
jgi:hypothetical protein